MALGNFYESDMYEKVDLDMAADYYKIAAEMNEPHALYKVGQLSEKGIYQYKNERDTRENVLKYYEAAMEQGSVDATIRLAQIYEKGELGVKVNKDQALSLYQTADNDEEAMNSIGSILYEKGQYKRAAEFFRKSVVKGNPTGLNNLGTCYELGRGVPVNVNKAYEFYEEASKKGNAQAMSNLGYLLFKKGKVSSTQQQFKEAAHWFRSSISHDYTIKDSHYYMGVMHQNGDGVEQCYKSAYKYYKAASDFEHELACERLGDL